MLSELNQKFESLFERAENELDNDNMRMARIYYRRAADVLHRMAAICESEEREQYVLRAQNLSELANDLPMPEEATAPAAPVAPPPAPAPTAEVSQEPAPSAESEPELEDEAEEPAPKPEVKPEPKRPEPKKPNDKRRELSPEEVILSGRGARNYTYRFNWNKLPKIRFEDVAGLEEVKHNVNMKVLLPLKNPDAFAGYGRRNGGGLLLYGPPGTGKTMIAAAIANEIGAKFCSVKPSDLLHQGLGQSEKAVRDLFAQARQFPCAVIYFDEMESLCPKSTRSQYSKNLRSELLAQLQGAESYGDDDENILYLIASTNKPWDIESAFLRPGRFGTKIYVPLPDTDARRYIVNRRLKFIKEAGIVEIDESLDVEYFVDMTVGCNGSDINDIFDKAIDFSVKRNIESGSGLKLFTQDDFECALACSTTSVQREDIEKLTEWKDEFN